MRIYLLRLLVAAQVLIVACLLILVNPTTASARTGCPDSECGASMSFCPELENNCCKETNLEQTPCITYECSPTGGGPCGGAT